MKYQCSSSKEYGCEHCNAFEIFYNLSLHLCSLHFSDQEERSKAVEAYRNGQKDVLVATDVASKGLDFADVQHVINYDMPDDVENYGEF